MGNYLYNSTTVKKTKLLSGDHLIYDLHTSKKTNTFLEIPLYESSEKSSVSLTIYQNFNDTNIYNFGEGSSLNYLYELHKVNENVLEVKYPTKEVEVFTKEINTSTGEENDLEYVFFNQNKTKYIVLTRTKVITEYIDAYYELINNNIKVRFLPFNDQQFISRNQGVSLYDENGNLYDICFEHVGYHKMEISSTRNKNEKVELISGENGVCNQVNILKKKEECSVFYNELSILLTYTNNKISSIEYVMHGKNNYQSKHTYTYDNNVLTIKNTISNIQESITFAQAQNKKYIASYSNALNNMQISYYSKHTTILNNQILEEYHFDEYGNISFVRNGQGLVRKYKYNKENECQLKAASLDVWEDHILNGECISEYYKKQHLMYDVFEQVDSSCPSSGNVFTIRKQENILQGSQTNCSFYYNLSGGKFDVVNVHIWTKLLTTSQSPLTASVTLLDERENEVESIISFSDSFDSTNTSWVYKILAIQANKAFEKVKVTYFSEGIIDLLKVNQVVAKHSKLQIYTYDDNSYLNSFFDGKKVVKMKNANDVNYLSGYRVYDGGKTICLLKANGEENYAFLDENGKVIYTKKTFDSIDSSREDYTYQDNKEIMSRTSDIEGKSYQILEYDEYRRITNQTDYLESDSNGFVNSKRYQKEITYDNEDSIKYNNLKTLIYKCDDIEVSKTGFSFDNKNNLSHAYTTTSIPLNGLQMNFQYDNLGRICEVIHKGNAIYKCSYNSNGDLAYENNGDDDKKVNYLYNNSNDNGPINSIKQIKYQNNVLTEFNYSSNSSKKLESVNEISSNTTQHYTYNEDKLVKISNHENSVETFEEIFGYNFDNECNQKTYLDKDENESLQYSEELFQNKDEDVVNPIKQFECNLINNIELKNSSFTLFNSRISRKESVNSVLEEEEDHYQHLVGKEKNYAPFLNPNSTTDIFSEYSHVYKKGVNYYDVGKNIDNNLTMKECGGLNYELNFNGNVLSLVTRFKVNVDDVSEDGTCLFMLSDDLANSNARVNNGIGAFLQKAQSNNNQIFNVVIKTYNNHVSHNTLVFDVCHLLKDKEVTFNLKFDFIREVINNTHYYLFRTQVEDEFYEHQRIEHEFNMKYLSVLSSAEEPRSEKGKVGAIILSEKILLSQEFFDYFCISMNEIEQNYLEEQSKIFIAKTFTNSDFDKISFNKTLLSNKGLKPFEYKLDDDAKNYDQWFKYKKDLFNSGIGRYVYSINNQTLAYRLPLDNSGTVIFKAMKQLSEEVEFLHLTNDNDIDVLIHSDKDNVLYATINGTTQVIGMMELSEYTDFIVCWSKIISSSSLQECSTTVNIYVNNVFKVNKNVQTGQTTHLMNIYIGRKKNSTLKYKAEIGEILNLLFTEKSYNGYNEITQSNLNDMEKSYYLFDEYQRLDEIITKTINNNVLKTKIVYSDSAYGTYWNVYNSPTGEKIYHNNDNIYDFSYFIVGGIVHYTFDIKNNYSKQYVYDEKFQLKRVNTMNYDEEISNINNIYDSVSYQYDSNSNLIEKKYENTNNVNQKFDYSGYDKTFTYDGMKLTKVNNSVITYENLYPISVKNVNNETTHSFEWMNKRLITLTYNQLNQQYRYTYNYKGLRTSVEKYVNSLLVSKKSYNYDIEGKLVLEKNLTYDSDGSISSRNTMMYKYDATGRHFSIIYNGVSYYYIYNMLGEILGLVDKNGNLAAQYEYDPFGMVTVLDANNVKNTSLSFIGNINPIRYKGYYYDVETGLFWLSSRYYSPELCRFISPDSVDYLDPSSINGLNLYAYCNNDPINRYDPSGHFWDYVLDAVFIGIGIYDFVKDPSWSKGLWLAADVVLAVLPFVPALSSARHLGKIDNVIDAASALNKIDNVNDAVGVIKYADDAQEIGTYLLKNVDGDVIYVGKGSRNRMMKNFNKFNADSFLYYPAKNIEMAFANEAYFMGIYGGAQSMMKNYRLVGGYERASRLLNKINSPGLRYLFYWF